MSEAYTSGYASGAIRYESGNAARAGEPPGVHERLRRAMASGQREHSWWPRRTLVSLSLRSAARQIG